MRFLIVPAALITGLIATGPVSAEGGVTVKGALTPVKARTSVMLIAEDGTSLTARVKKQGGFVLKAPKGKVAKKLNPRKGRGPTLHVLRDGKYVGPVVLASKNRRAGYLRLASGRPARVGLGKIALKSAGFAVVKKAPKKSLVDRSRTKMRNGVPIGAGSQGATGRLRMAAWATVTEALPASESALGSDPDADGVPNVADVDMNGDQILDAAQAERALQTTEGPLGGQTVLGDRPEGLAFFAKILDMDQFQPINTNRNPALTWEQLTEYLRTGLAIEAIVPATDIRALLCGNPEDMCAAALAVTKLTMDCSTLSYCQPGAPAVIQGSPGSGFDQQPLSTLLDSGGRIVMPQDSHVPGTTIMETGFQLNFRPRVTSPSNLQFSGDAFEFALLDADGTSLARQPLVLTSSVATPAEWAAINGTPAPTRFAVNEPIAVDTTAPLQLSFYRPQRLSEDSGDRPQMLDRGGLQYSVYMMSTDPGRNDFYWCRASQVTSASPELADLTPPPTPGREQMLFDKVMNPENGRALNFSIDIAGCLADPAMGPGALPAPGSTMALEMESQDSDGNRTRSRLYVRLP